MADKKEKPAATPEQIAERKAARLIGWTVWLQSYRAANPEASAEDRKAAWKDAKKAQMRAGRRTLKALTKKGFALTPAAKEA